MVEIINPKPEPGYDCDAVITNSRRLLEAVLVGFLPGGKAPVPGGVQAELRCIFDQLDKILKDQGVDRTAVASARLYLEHVNEEIAAANVVYKEFFGAHRPSRRAYGVDLQGGMAIEAAFVVELPDA
jgi:enamine deaminase RidA (YjgF/YER057c/UK114 family)